MKTVFFQTFGCQMNVSDSDELLCALSSRGYTQVTDADAADLVVVNTCSVRERAEERALARITEYAARKRAQRRSKKKLWVIGCMAERLGEDLKKQIRGIDAVIGARELEDPEAVVLKYCGGDKNSEEHHVARGVSEFVPIMRGCNNYCAYCIVPYVRGPEQSIPADDLVRTIQKRVERGVKEITLLGQNVNSYDYQGLDFSELLRRIAKINGLDRLRFTASHPKDCSEKLILAMAELPKLCHHIHLPVQAGSDRILALMNRRYTRDHYLSLIAMIRKHLPDADITTDLLVGFPSETEADFAETLSLVEQVRFTAAFMFTYSVRAGTKAATLDDDVARTGKLERLKRLITLQNSITRSYYDTLVGRDLDVMLYGPLEKAGSGFLRAQDNGCKRVLLPCTDVKAGTILRVRGVRSSGMTLIAEQPAMPERKDINP
jgi:tRNA-2-methylthio-N6-dimethylallyladenosine synthase